MVTEVLTASDVWSFGVLIAQDHLWSPVAEPS